MEMEVPLTNGMNSDVHLEADLQYEATQHRAEVLDNLHKLRKENQFCDAILVIGRHEIPIHRAVVASSSTFLMELFEKYKNNNEEKEGLVKNMIKLKEMEHESFLYLLDYMYTGRLSIPGPHVKAVYKAAIKLKMADAVRTCSQFLSENLTVANCLGVRKAAVDDQLRTHVDLFIQNNINTVTACKKFYGLPTVKVEIIGAEGDLIVPSNSRHLLELTLNWARENINTQKPRLDDLTEQVNILYLNKDNTLTDCINIDDERTKEDGEVHDYKIIKKRHSNPMKGFETSPKGPLAGNVKVFSINPENPVDPKEWTVIASCQTEKKTFMSLCMLNGDLAVLLIHCRKTASQSPSDSGSEAPDSPTGNPESFERSVSLTPLATMTSPRCGFGLTVVSGKLFACGGYDRGECMDSTEFYDPKTNKWISASNMSVHRGRFNIESVNGIVYAVGGSNGQVEQRSVECYSPDNNKWTTVCKVEKAKTSQALISVGGKLYCIGGCVGQNSVTDCEVFDTETKTWSKIAPLPTARYQIAVSYFQGFIYAIGGTDGWNCLGITEIYDIKSNKWVVGPSLNVNRRGAGCDVLNGKLYVVGGSDGSHSLKSSEILENNSFILGPPMSIGRANVSVVTLNNRLFAVGGFSGKKFLDTFEYLDSKNDEWSGYCPANSNNQARQESGNSS